MGQTFEYLRENAIVIALAIAAAVLVLAVPFRYRWIPDATVSEDLISRFRSDFSMLSHAQQQTLILFYMRKHACGREKAMLFALEDKRKTDEGE
ncbi:hypothetical protein NA8A_04075 [Nitratireductor indicus C115]|uniref:Uncharacterized protein n=1 Tax=Nitratireductor indicus C115 TaxID=1231190 RepID=K2PSA7_9HYPH|nr:hypothetical protein [Nitratireductor indicus]EKF43957.1 hypothetical protein NA8A_04075 [Nitratireductor indicus C115]SFQ13357.1 hypothetical protein SAMN05216176_101500 [Nitratireductor indicus]